MLKDKPGIPKGTRDFGPVEMARRTHIFDTIREVFHRYAYQPLETPAMENLSTLTGKYGEEGDKLLFKILNSGDFLAAAGLAGPSALQNGHLASGSLAPMICEKGLRYDLTVPFARYVVQHRNEIQFPFKRYQIQPVWRADRPQKGRYREFYQCDVDVIGSSSLLLDAELISIIGDVFDKLGLKITVKLNNRRILAGIAEYLGATDDFNRLTVALDKLDKSGIEKVLEELRLGGFSHEAIQKLMPFLELGGSNDEKLARMKDILRGSPSGLRGISDTEQILAYLNHNPVHAITIFDLTLARGLNYYTGAIIEVKSTEVAMGSICGGGRYDDLTGIFGLPGVSGTGISFGADRIYDVMAELGLFPEDISTSARAFFINFGQEEEKYALKLLSELRKHGIPSDIYPEPASVKKQFTYAGQRKIPFVVLAGPDEIKAGVVVVRDMRSGDQANIIPDSLVAWIRDAQ